MNEEIPLLFPDLGEMKPIPVPEVPPDPPKIDPRDTTLPLPFTPLMGAEFSECKRYRWALWRRFLPKGKTILFIGMNPSIADAVQNDPTVTRMEGFAKREGCATILVGNCFPWVSTDPKGLRDCPDLRMDENIAWLVKLRKKADICVLCWGNGDRLKRKNYGDDVIAGLRGLGPLHRLGKPTKHGKCRHPLYLRNDTPLVEIGVKIEDEVVEDF